MTFEEIKESDKDFIFADDVKDVICVSPNALRKQAHEDPSKLGFPVMVCGTKVRIPRKAFIKFIEG